ncbi:MAG TPA: serine/threonine-protein kinase [Candidatus Obscuribacter sp.]|nr:serine/threonine-protein kinase [Candidatus Obscuribacter sp.]HNA71828.1 serine/threonine-protein kinase [Candidatus Obscuribacter sp.]HNB14333.1 serine/threonine-protein kinase [Candidatus Obscuribacter sp.]HND05348.1 serine/threonine-protein kinase [Candidatus Obscuribacter sp.]HNG73258.1 serine/threonine-protein kinase [Candidatus Obscuribacter sp.]
MLAGQILDDTYEVLRTLGCGGMGEVYEVRHLVLQKKMALKTLRADAANPDNWQRFVHEARILARLHHPAIVEIYDMAVTPDGQPFYTMELLRGLSLQDYLLKRGPLPEALALSLFKPVLSALACAHEAGVIHRDIKPHNIMLLGEAEAFADPLLASVRVKVVDFGLAKLRGGNCQQSLTATGAVFGSPYYMSPEQCLGRRVDERSDLYSVGCALFQTLTGAVPISGASSTDTMRAKVTQPSPRLSEVSTLKFSRLTEELVAVLLATDAEERFDSARQVLLSLDDHGEKSAGRINLFNAANALSEGSHSLAPQKGRRQRLLMLGVGALGLPLLLLLASVCLSSGPMKSALPASAPVSGSVATATVASSSPSWFSTVDQSGGRVFDFSSLGTGLANPPKGLAWQGKTEEEMRKRWMASELGEMEELVNGGDGRILDLRHAVYVPPQADLRFRPGLPFYRQPSLLSRFRLDEIHSFDFRPAAGDRKRSMSDILPQLLPFTRLRELIFRDTQLSAADLHDMGLLKNLTCLSLLTVDGITGEDLGRENLLLGLKQLRLDGLRDLSRVFEKLSHSKRIETLEIHTSNLSDADIDKLVLVKNLRDLRIRNCDLTDAQLGRFSKLPQLCKLEVRRNAITVDGLRQHLPEILSKRSAAASQNRLEVILSADFCTPSEKEDFKKAFPSTIFKYVP